MVLMLIVYDDRGYHSLSIVRDLCDQQKLDSTTVVVENAYQSGVETPYNALAEPAR